MKNTPLRSIARSFITGYASHYWTGEVGRRLHSFIVIVVQALAFKVSVLAGSWGGTLQKLVSENISIINVGISIND